jgi:hypothetical protein
MVSVMPAAVTPDVAVMRAQAVEVAVEALNVAMAHRMMSAMRAVPPHMMTARTVDAVSVTDVRAVVPHRRPVNAVMPGADAAVNAMASLADAVMAAAADAVMAAASMASGMMPAAAVRAGMMSAIAAIARCGDVGRREQCGGGQSCRPNQKPRSSLHGIPRGFGCGTEHGEGEVNSS